MKKYIIIICAITYAHSTFAAQALQHGKSKTFKPAPLLTEKIKADLVEIRKELAELADAAKQSGTTLSLNEIDIAVRRDKIATLHYLLAEQKVNVNRKTLAGTPLLYAKSVAAIDLLLKYGADVNMANSYGRTPILPAISNNDLETVKKYIQHGANINHKTRTGMTPLGWAVENGQIDIAKFLIGIGAQCDDQDLHPKLRELGYTRPLPTPLTELQVQDAIETIKKSASAEKKEDSVLVRAVSTGHLPVVEHFVRQSPILINQPDENNELPLFKAIETRNVPIINFLLKHGANANGIYNMKSALQWAIEHGGARMSIIETLLKHGANPSLLLVTKDQVDYHFTPPLPFDLALAKNRKDIALRLIHAEVGVNNTDGDGLAPIHRVAKGTLPLHALAILAELGADLNLPTKSTESGTRTPFALALEQDQPTVARALMQYPRVNLDTPLEHPFIQRSAPTMPINLIIKNIGQARLDDIQQAESVWLEILSEALNLERIKIAPDSLDLAAKLNLKDVALLLLKKGATLSEFGKQTLSIAQPVDNFRRALTTDHASAAIFDNLIDAVDRLDKKTVKKIIDEGFDINSIPLGLPYAPIHSAITLRNPVPKMQILVDAGADVNLPTSDQGSSFAFAVIQRGAPDAAAFLIEHGAKLTSTNQASIYYTMIDNITKMKQLGNETKCHSWSQLLQKTLNSKQMRLDSKDFCYALECGNIEAAYLLMHAGIPPCCYSHRFGYESLKSVVEKSQKAGHAAAEFLAPHIKTDLARIVAEYMGVQYQQDQQAPAQKSTQESHERKREEDDKEETAQANRTMLHRLSTRVSISSTSARSGRSMNSSGTSSSSSTSSRQSNSELTDSSDDTEL